MSEPKKYGYGVLGILVGILILICGTIALALFVAGVALAGFSWLIFISPEFLETYRISFLGERITDPSYAFLLFFISGLTFTAIGIILFGFVYYLAKTIQKIGKELEIKI